MPGLGSIFMWLYDSIWFYVIAYPYINLILTNFSLLLL